MDFEGLRHPLGEDMSPDGVWWTDASDVIRFADEGIARIAGIPASEIVGRRIPDDFAPETMREFLPLYEKAKALGEPVFYDRVRVVTPQGRESFQSGWLIPARFGGEDGGELCCTVRDVTATVLAERELVASRERWRTMALLAPVGIFETDANGSCTFVNRKWCELTGLTPEHACGQGWMETLHPDDRDWIGETWAAFTASSGRFDHECRFLHPDGSVAWVRGIAGATRDEAGATTGYLGIIADISERVRMADQLQEEKARAEKYLEIADLILIALDENGVVVHANKKARELLETEERPLVGSDWFEGYIPAAVRRSVRGVFFGLIGEDPRPMETFENGILLPDGTERTIEWHNSVLCDDSGKIAGSLSLGLDVTETREAEVIRIESEAKDRFLAKMSHELRTPLNSIIGFSGVLLSGLAGPITGEQHHQLEMINESGGQLLELVNDLLDTEQVVTGKVPLVLEELEWSDFLRETAEEFRSEVARSGLSFDLRPCDASCRVVADRARVRQIIANLVSNACKFTSQGVVTIGWDHSDTEAIAYVEDTGEGIPTSQLEQIFEFYHQVPRVGVAKSRGAGLGVPLSRSYARLLGGDLTVESEVGTGSTFTLTIPRARKTSS